MQNKILNTNFLYKKFKHDLKNPVNAVIHGTAIASFTVSGFGLEALSKMTDKELNKKIKGINIQ